MSDHPQYPHQPAAAEQPLTPADAPAPTTPPPAVATAPPQEAGPRRRNVLGIVALVISVIGFVFACVPGALIVGWVLLPVAFILGIVAVCLSGRAKWQGVTAIIVSVVGTIVGIIVFTTVVAAAFNDAFGGTAVNIAEGDQPAAVEEAPAVDEEPVEDTVGTRENPAPIGAVIEGEEWTVTVNSVTLGANDQVTSANILNEAPDAGTEYILVNYTATYTGDDPDGQGAVFVGVDYVTADGVTVDPLEKLVVAPDAIDTMSPLYSGASVTGNTAIQVPSPADGVLAIRPGLVADKVFVAIS